MADTKLSSLTAVTTIAGTDKTYVVQSDGSGGLRATIDQIKTWMLTIAKASGNGIKVDTTTPTWGWRDITGSIKTRTSGGTVPSFVVYRGGIYQYSFGTAGGVVETFNEAHWPHDYVPLTDSYIHCHWSTITAPTGNVNWLFELAWAKGFNQDTFEGFPSSGATAVVSVTQSAVAAFKHQVAEVQISATNGLINPLAGTTYSISSGAATLTSNQAVFTAADIGRTVRVVGAGAASGNLDTTISAYTSTTSVTVADNAGTTITNSANAFQYRVIDTADLEVDGILLVRMYRDSSRAADTLDVAPFVHMIDVHYQSSNVATKAKAPDFYT